MEELKAILAALGFIAVVVLIIAIIEKLAILAATRITNKLYKDDDDKWHSNSDIKEL